MAQQQGGCSDGGNRNYRRRRSMASSIVSDTAYIANRLSWKGALLFGTVLFAIFYWVLPAWIGYQMQDVKRTVR